MFLLSLVAVAFAPPTPQPVRGKFTINGQNAVGFIVVMENLRTGEKISGHENSHLITESGGFGFDLSDFSQYQGETFNYVGDEIQAYVEGFSGDKVSFIPDKSPYDFGIHISDARTDLFFVCSDGSIKKSSILCPREEPEIIETIVEVPGDTKTIETIICEDGSEVSVASDCPKEDYSSLQILLIGMIAAIIGIFSWGKGFAGLIKYYLRLAKEAKGRGERELAIKYQQRAEKMAKTVLTNFMAGKYKK